MTDSLMFWMLKEDPESLAHYLSDRVENAGFLRLKRAEVGSATLAAYGFPLGLLSPKYEIKGGDEDTDFIHYYDSPYDAEYWVSWKDIKKSFRDSKGLCQTRGIAFTCSDALKGKVGTQLAKKQKITLVNYGVLKTSFDDMPTCYFFDEKPHKKFIKRDSLDLEFNTFQFQTNDGRNVLLLTTEPFLPLEEITVEGNLIELEDLSQVGHKKMIDVKLPVMILCKYKRTKKPFSSLEEMQLALRKEGLHGAAWFDYVMSSKDGNTYRSIVEFEWLLSSILLSGKHSGYPLHLLIVGIAGTGKTTVLEGVNDKIEPNHPIVEGGASTIKSLIPSFKGLLPESGALLQSNRVICIDEFLRIMTREANHPERQVELLTCLNTLLEHKVRLFSSGNGKLNGCMTARLLSVSNPPVGVECFEDLANKVDKSFLSRLVVWWQGRKEISLVHSEKGRKSFKWVREDLLVRVCDLLQDLKTEYNSEVVKAIFGKYQPYLKDSNLKDVYDARYGKHHIHCLMDGIIKTRMIVRGGNLQADRDDYIILEMVWDRLVENWQIRKEGMEGFLPPKVVE